MLVQAKRLWKASKHNLNVVVVVYVRIVVVLLHIMSTTGSYGDRHSMWDDYSLSTIDENHWYPNVANYFRNYGSMVNLAGTRNIRSATIPGTNVLSTYGYANRIGRALNYSHFLQNARKRVAARRARAQRVAQRALVRSGRSRDIARNISSYL